MTKFKVALGLAKLTVLELIAFAQLIVTKMTAAIAVFVTPDPALADITTAATKLDASRKAVDSAKSTLAEKVAIQNTDEQALKDLLTNEGKYVDIKANGDKAIIESAGMPVAEQGGPVGELPQVHNLSLTHGDNPGEADAHWTPVKKRLNYTLQVCPVNPIDATKWATVANPTKSSHTITGQVSGDKIWVRVCANGTAGSGPFSDPAIITVP